MPLRLLCSWLDHLPTVYRQYMDLETSMKAKFNDNFGNLQTRQDKLRAFRMLGIP